MLAGEGVKIARHVEQLGCESVAHIPSRGVPRHGKEPE